MKIVSKNKPQSNIDNLEAYFQEFRRGIIGDTHTFESLEGSKKTHIC